MSKEIKLPTITLDDGMELTLNARGAVCEGEGDDEQIHVTAGELDRIVERATFLRGLPKGPKGPGTVEGGHNVVFCVGNDNGENPGKLGDVYVNCKHIPYATVMRAQKLSKAIRARRQAPARE